MTSVELVKPRIIYVLVMVSVTSSERDVGRKVSIRLDYMVAGSETMYIL